QCGRRRRRDPRRPRTRRHPAARQPQVAGRIPETEAAEGQGQRARGPARRAVRGEMRFWDSSAIVPLLLQEAATAAMRTLLDEDPDMVVWPMTSLEVTSALWRRARAGKLEERARAGAAEALAELETVWNVLIDIG